MCFTKQCDTMAKTQSKAQSEPSVRKSCWQLSSLPSAQPPQKPHAMRSII